MADFLKGDEEAIQLFSSLPRDEIAVSIITYAELYEGVVGARDSDVRRRQLDEVAARLDVLSIDSETARLFAEHRASLRRRGAPIPDLDLLIAATALRHDLTLLSRDRHFERVTGLKRHSVA